MVHEGTQLSGLQKVPKVPKRDLVDTCYHASRVTRYGATLGLGFPTTWEGKDSSHGWKDEIK